MVSTDFAYCLVVILSFCGGLCGFKNFDGHYSVPGVMCAFLLYVFYVICMSTASLHQAVLHRAIKSVISRIELLSR